MRSATSAKCGVWIGLILCLGLSGQGRCGQGSSEAVKKVGEKKKVDKQPATFGESWTTLSVRETSLRMKEPELAEKDDIPNTGFIRERHQVTWRVGDPFDLYVIRPRGAQRAPVILYLYSFPEDTEQFKNNFWCETAVSGGYAAVGFVGAVTGHRTRYRLGKEWFASEMQEALGSTVHDVQLILDYLGTRKDLDTTRVAMFGSGSGGAIAIMASAADPRIGVLDLLGPWGDWPDWVAESKVIPDEERAKFMKPEFLAKVAALEPIAWLPKIKAKALRIQDVRVNKSMPDEAQEKLEAAAPDFAVINEYGNGRAMMASQPSISLFQWMKDRLRGDGEAPVVAKESDRVHFFPAVETPAEHWPNVGPSTVGKETPSAKPKPASDKEKPNGGTPK